MHVHIENRENEEKDTFYMQLEAEQAIPKLYIKIIIDVSVNIGEEETYRKTVGSRNKHEESNHNGHRIVGFTIGRNVMIRRGTYIQQQKIYKSTLTLPKKKR